MALRLAVIWDRNTAAWQQNCVALLVSLGVVELVDFGQPDRSTSRRVGRIVASQHPHSRAYQGFSKVKAHEFASRHTDSADYSHVCCNTEPRRIDFFLIFATKRAGVSSPPPCRFGHWSVEFVTKEQVGSTQHPVLAVDIIASKLDSDKGRQVLWRGHFPILTSRRRTLMNAMDALPEVCVRLCREIETHGMLGATITDEAALGGTVNNVLARPPLDALCIYAQKLFFLEIWNVGLVEANVETLLSGMRQDIRWLEEQGGFRYIADPFALISEGRLILLVEEFNHWCPKGRIAAKVLPSGVSSGAAMVAFDCRCHFSYPFLLEWDGEIFCVPEAHETGSILLYRAINFPDRWEFAATLVRDFPGIDPTIFRHGGLWWLLASKGGGGSTERLYGWYAERLDGPWIPHLLNPLKCDVRSSRPAGRPFVAQGRLIRPAQDCSSGYGGAVTFNHVIALTPTNFEEVTVGALFPDLQGAYPDGLHTVCGLADITFIDGKRHQFSLLAPIIKLWQRWVSWRRRLDFASSNRSFS
jgi:hypothetical protein